MAQRKVKAAATFLGTLHEGNERHMVDLTPYNMPITVKIYSGEWCRWYTGNYANGDCAFCFGIDLGNSFDLDFARECISES